MGWPKHDAGSVVGWKRRGKVAAVELDPRSHPYDDLDFALRYWEARCGGRFAPARADIDPTELGPVLPRIMLADVLREPLRFRYRLSGTAIRDVHGMDMTHRSPRDLRPPEYGALIDGHYAEAVERKVPILHLIRLDTEEAARSYVRLLLPLSTDGTSVDMLMAIDGQDRNSRHSQALREFFERTGGAG